MYTADAITIGTLTTSGSGAYPGAPAFVAVRDVWADMSSVTRTEFYKAQAAGLKLTIQFVVRSENWEPTCTAVKCGDKYFRIERSYATGTSVTLYCSDISIEGVS